MPAWLKRIFGAMLAILIKFTMEQTLFICRSVDVFMPIPPRTGRGFVSGEWLVENKIATTRLRVIAIDNQLEARLEDLETYVCFQLLGSITSLPQI